MKKPEVRKLSLNGPQGLLEATISIPAEMSGSVAIVCHPHPLHGGSMDNKVVHYTARALLGMGVAVLRFNFRGVGKSAGSFDEAIGEVEDCLAAVDWVQNNFPDYQLLMAGFSFGSYIAVQAATRVDPAALITIAPAVNLYDFNAIKPVECPWLLIQGDADEVVPVEAVRQWLAETDQEITAVWMSGSSHFFHGRLLELADNIDRWIKDIF